MRVPLATKKIQNARKWQKSRLRFNEALEMLLQFQKHARIVSIVE
jgi:hypothetical protein